MGIAYAHGPDQKRKKLDDKGEKCIFISYDTSSKEYRLYNPLTKKVIIARDVEFDETDYWRWSNEERQIVGLFFEDDNDDFSTINDENDHQSLLSSPDPTTLASTPSTSQSSTTKNEK